MSLSTGSRRISAEPVASATMAARSVSEAHQRRRLTAPLLDFVSALRGAIAAFAQGQVGARRDLTPCQAAEIRSLLEHPPARDAADTRRVLYLGDLSPQSGVVDLLACLVAWAEQHRDVPVDICWAGSGDLLGMLRAQSMPRNLKQSFKRLSDIDTPVALAADRGILAVPNAGPVDLLPMAQAMAAGLPVLGSARCPEVRIMVTSAATGWLFDPLSPAEMAGALDAAFATTPARLGEMRAAARRRLNALCDEWLGAGEGFPPLRNPAQFSTGGQV